VYVRSGSELPLPSDSTHQAKTNFRKAQGWERTRTGGGLAHTQTTVLLRVGGPPPWPPDPSYPPSQAGKITLRHEVNSADSKEAATLQEANLPGGR